MKKRANNIRSQHTRLLNGLPPTSTVPRNLKKNGMTYATYATAISRCLRYQTALEPTTTLRMMSVLHMSIGDEDKQKELMEIGSRSKHDFAAKCTDYGRRLGACK